MRDTHAHGQEWDCHKPTLENQANKNCPCWFQSENTKLWNDGKIFVQNATKITEKLISFYVTTTLLIGAIKQTGRATGGTAGHEAAVILNTYQSLRQECKRPFCRF
jgi:hypothetical protein